MPALVSVTLRQTSRVVIAPSFSHRGVTSETFCTDQEVYQTGFTPDVSEILPPHNRSFFALMIAAPSNQSRHKFPLTWKQEDERKLLPSILTPSLPPSTPHTFYFLTSIPTSALMSCFGCCTAVRWRLIHVTCYFLFLSTVTAITPG